MFGDLDCRHALHLALRDPGPVQETLQRRGFPAFVIEREVEEFIEWINGFNAEPGQDFLAALPRASAASASACSATSDEAWSVVIKGTARVLQSGDEIEAAEKLGLKSWIPTLKDFYIELKPVQLSGRHFNLGDQPERY